MLRGRICKILGDPWKGDGKGGGTIPQPPARPAMKLHSGSRGYAVCEIIANTLLNVSNTTYSFFVCKYFGEGVDT